MPPRYAYWTIIVDDQPTAFRAGSQEDLMPTFKRLKEKQPSATMMWFQNGKLWPSRIDAQEAMRARGEMGRRGDERQAGQGFRDRERKPTRRTLGMDAAWRALDACAGPQRRRQARLETKGRVHTRAEASRTNRVEIQGLVRGSKPEWKPKGSFDRERKSE